MKIVVSTFGFLNIPKTVKETNKCKTTGAILIYMTPEEFNTFLQLNNYRIDHQECEQIVGAIQYIMDGSKVVAQYWDNENERQTWMINNKDTY